MIYALDGISPVMSVENAMKKPEQFLGKPSVLIMAQSFITLLYCFVGFFGYVRFGEETKGSISLNLPLDQWSAIAGQALIGCAIYFTFGLSFFVPTEILFKKLEKRLENNRFASETIIRTLLISVMVGIGLLVPGEPIFLCLIIIYFHDLTTDVGQFISLVGAFYSACLALFMPAFVQTVFLQAHGGFGTLNWLLWKNIFLMIFSFGALTTGMFFSIKDIVETYTKD